MNSEFKKIYALLNKEQKASVDLIEGPVMVIAGPGTGKTQILILRIANILIKTQINPENILALTFSEAASFEMRERLARIIGTAAFRTEISTFHSFANSIIKSYPDEFPKLLSSEAITEIEQIELIEKIIELLDLKLLKPFGEPLYYLKDILQSINNLKKEGVNVEGFKEAVKKQKEDFEKTEDLFHEKGKYKGEMKGVYQTLKKDIEKEEEFAKVFESYQEKIRAEKKYDFNDMLLEVIKVLQSNRSLLLRVQEKYQYILVDEHQDTNAAQNKLIELVASFYDTPNLFVVGDEKQAIYRFQGASLENFLYFKKLYPQAGLINLETSYRSHQLILDASGSLIEKNISANILPQKNLISEKGLKIEKLKLVELSSFNLEYEYVAIDIAKKIKMGVDSSSISVLARRNIDLAPLTQILNRLGIKFVVQSDQDILKDLHIEKLLLLFKSIGNPFDQVVLTKILQIDFLNIDPFDVYKLLVYARKNKIEISQAIDTLNKALIRELELKNSDTLTKFYSTYKGWVTLSNNIPFDDLFVKVVNESGFKEYFLKSEARYEILNKLTGLFDEVKIRLSKDPKFKLTDFLRLLNLAEKHKVSLRAKSDDSNQDGVKLLTVHKSKGKEFDFVYMINCLDGRWGNSRKRGAKIKIPWEYMGGEIKADVSFEEIEDERRLFYVGMTRAKKGVTLTFSKLGIDGKEQLPSQFLQEIDEKFIENIDVSEFEKSFDQLVVFDAPAEIKINPADKKYLQSLFLEKGLSVTGLDNFLNCPWKYFFRNLVVLPDVKNKHLIFGTAIHFALESFIKLSKSKSLGAQFLTLKFKESLSKHPLGEKDEKELIEKGEKILNLYFEQIIPNWPKDIQSEMNIKGVKLSKDITLNGRLDMIEILENGWVRIHDFKTGKAKPRAKIDGSDAHSDYNYKRQLVFYRILLDKYKEGLFKMKEGVIDFVEPDEKGKFKSEVFIISDQDVKELEKIIKSVGEQIISLSFWNQKCEDAKCEYCKLKEMVF